MDHIAIPSFDPFFFPQHPAPPSPAPAPYPNSTQRRGEKAALRIKGGCLTCRLRHKVCDNERADGACKTCARFRIECLGFSPRRPDWMKDKEKVKICTDAIRNHLITHGMIKGKPRLPANAPSPVHFLYFSHLVSSPRSQPQPQSHSHSPSYSRSVASASASEGTGYSTGSLVWNLDDMVIPDTLSDALFRPSLEPFVPPPLPFVSQDPSLSCSPTHTYAHNHAYSYHKPDT
ncbi:hypothetical protein BOTBODRAFT_189615 [Botryobasidium botryosum FD-172 SS1]|uniref:Zn(2)-C6 fungal-type domain-containing protein n=1 Tax=Botryobasidium botryosum (strain FD-172 SS1) TaxID=930990 RepID=A0A067MJQ4_BOTB1|nr:hypothetical protein BOTBODRAFT_189615 [Botryobasidium botryosum FD-172 SS1]